MPGKFARQSSHTNMTELTKSLIDAAAEFLRPRIRRTPVERSATLTEILGVPTWLKLEHLQITGSFKIRGAFFRLSRLTEEERRCGIVTCSAGNHGKAVAYAARELGIAATIYVPSTVDEAKLRGIQAAGARAVVAPFPGFDETNEWALEAAQREGRPFLSAFDDPAVMAGNGGTLAAEILEDLPEVCNFIFPVGGGSLGAGLSYLVRERKAGCRLIAVQHELSPALKLSFERGAAMTKLLGADTLAAGVEGGVGEKTFEVMRTRLDEVALISEAEMFAATRWMAEEHQYMVEPSGAVALAACLARKMERLNGPTVVVFTGRNVSIATWSKILRA
jgi:threonine dehydratase